MGFRFLAIVAITGTLGIAGCGNDTQSKNGTGPTFSGPITQISANSITINNSGMAQTFSTNNAQVVSDSDNGTQLSPGEVVKVEGSHDGNNGHADKIIYDSTVEGIVTANDIQADNTGSMTVMGQIVIVDDMTMYDDGLNHASDIPVDALIEVSGIFQADDSILAKHIEYKLHGDIEVKGVVINPVTEAGETTFSIGACTITADAATEFSGMGSAADLVDGLEVEVKSSVELVNVSNGCAVTATRIEVEDIHEDKDEFEYRKGEVVSELVEGRFTLNTLDDHGATIEIVIVVNADTAFHGGGDGDIVPGAIIHVHGHYDADGNLVAKEIEFKAPMELPHVSMARFDAYVDAVDVAGGSITVLGQMIMVTDMTVIDGHAAVPQETTPVTDPVKDPAPIMGMATDIPTSMTLADIAQGDYVQVRFEKDIAGTLSAAKIVVEQGVGADLPSEIEGFVTGVDAAADTIYIEGVAVAIVHDPVSGELITHLDPADLILGDELIGQESFTLGVYSGDAIAADKLWVKVPEPTMPVM